MEYNRFFDISCIKDDKYRKSLENAIHGVNLACSIYVDAWMYVNQGLLFDDAKRVLKNVNMIPSIIFKNMEKDNHSSESLQKVLSDLFSISNDYESWVKIYQENNSLLEEDEKFWNMWRLNTLNYTVVKSKEGLEHIIDSFLILKQQRGRAPVDLETELMNLLGSTLEEKIETLSKFTSESLIKYKNSLLRKKEEIDHELLYSSSILNERMRILKNALKSNNLDMIKDAINSEWLSFAFISSNEYKMAIDFINHAEFYKLRGCPVFRE